MTICFIPSIAISAWRVPANGCPVASMMHSIPSKSHSALASCVTKVRPVSIALPSEVAEYSSSSQPTRLSEVRALPASRSATPTM